MWGAMGNLIAGCRRPASTQERGAPDDASLGHPDRGVSVRHLAHDFVDAVRAAGLGRDARVYDVEPAVIVPKGAALRCPRDGELGAAYVDAVHGPEHAGMASCMLSYTWGYKVSDIVDALQAFCEARDLSPCGTYVWICCLCVNQHRVRAARAAGRTVPFEEFRRVFGERVQGIGHIVAVMAPWHSPEYLTRVWCCFEMYTAKTLEANVRVTIAMPPQESTRLRDALVACDQSTGFQIFAVLGQVDIEKASASVPDDKENIMRLIREGPGVQGLNSVVISHMRDWIASTCELQVPRWLDSEDLEPESKAHLCVAVAQVLRLQGFMERALSVCRVSREYCQATGQCQTPTFLNAIQNEALAHGALQHHELAVQLFEEGCRLQRERLPPSVFGADLIRNYANAKSKVHEGGFEGEAELYQEALQMYVDCGAEETQNYIATLRTQAQVMMRDGDVASALQALERCQAAYEAMDAPAPGLAHTLRLKGIALSKQGDTALALHAYRAARSVYQKTGTLETPFGAECLKLLAEAEAAEAASAMGLICYGSGEGMIQIQL